MGKTITQEDLDGPNKEREKLFYYNELIKNYGTLSHKDQSIFQKYFDGVELFVPSVLQPNKIVYKAFFKNPIDGNFLPLIYTSKNSIIKAIYSGIIYLRTVI